MNFKFFYKNNKILPIDEATIPLSNIEYAYGYGVYELIKVRNSIIYFADQHSKRLLQSAKFLGIDHEFTSNYITNSMIELVYHNAIVSANIKILLLGGKEKSSAQLILIPSNPLYPDRKLYISGAKTITINHQRFIPQAKTLNMLGSYLAYKIAKQNNCYDALLIDKNNNIIEGTRTNFFAIKNKTIITQDNNKILQGVTRDILLLIADRNKYKIEIGKIKKNDLSVLDGAFLTSTSSNIMPLKQIDNYKFQTISIEIKNLIKIYNDFLKSSGGKFNSAE